MKHTVKVTLALILFFFAAQFVGLLVVNNYIDHKKTAETKIISYNPLPYKLERPEVKNESTSWIYVTIAILAGTVLILLLIRFNKPFVWRAWVFITIWLTLTISFSAFIKDYVAGILALTISIIRFFRPNVIVQNASEIFIYGGLAAVFVPIMNLFSISILLIVISVYDYIAVFKTKHMIQMAEFQSKSNVFAGIMIPYDRGKIKIKERIKSVLKIRNSDNSQKPDSALNSGKSLAVIGGGDIGFTLLFAGVIMKGLMLKDPVLIGFLKALIIPVFVTASLTLLLLKGRQNKFYPAMPFLSVGCFIGYAVVWLISG